MTRASSHRPLLVATRALVSDWRLHAKYVSICVKCPALEVTKLHRSNSWSNCTEVISPSSQNQRIRMTQVHRMAAPSPYIFVSKTIYYGVTSHLLSVAALGYEHLPPANVEEELAGIRAAPRAYGRAMLEEAKGWNRIRAQSDDRDRSESGGSESNTNSNTDSSRSGELSGLFRFSPDDTILIVDDSKWFTNRDRGVVSDCCATHRCRCAQVPSVHVRGFRRDGSTPCTNINI